MDNLTVSFDYKFMGGDAMSYYAVHTSRPCTVREFVDWVLERSRSFHEWGTIQISGPDKFWPAIRAVDYKNGAVIENGHHILRCDPSAFDRYGDVIIKKIKAVGGYSAMDYCLSLSVEPETNIVTDSN